MPKEEVKKSKNPITGIVNVTGGSDTGKTRFAFENGAQPERTFFVDDDVKGKAIVDQIKKTGHKLGGYRNLVDDAKGMRELELHDLCLKIIDSIESDKYDALIWDTWTRFENTFHPVVASNPNRFRQFYSAMGQIKGAEQWGAAFDYEASILSTLIEKVPLVILTSHLKKNEKRMEIAESKKPLIQKSILRVYLRNSEDSPQPTGLILKRLSRTEVTEDGIMTVNVTHRKMRPFTWERLLYYWKNPVGNVQPTNDEKPNEFELSILDGILTADQKDVLRLAVIEAEKEQAEIRAMEALSSANGYPKNKIEFINGLSELNLTLIEAQVILGHPITKDNNFRDDWDILKAKVK